MATTTKRPWPKCYDRIGSSACARMRSAGRCDRIKYPSFAIDMCRKTCNSCTVPPLPYVGSRYRVIK